MASPSPEYVGHRLEVFIGVFCPLMLLLVALRFYSRTLTARPYSADDWLIVASLLGQFIQSGAALGKGPVRIKFRTSTSHHNSTT